MTRRGAARKRARGDGIWAGAWAAALVVGVLALAAACGGGGDLSGQEIADRVADAIEEPGMVYHAAGDDNSEVWIDAENELFRRTEATSNGELLSVGDGWVRTGYDPFENKIMEEDANPEGDVRPRIDHPMITWLEALGALGFAQDFKVIGETTADGRTVLAVEAQAPIASGGQLTGGTLVGRVEVDPETYLPLAFERREDAPAGETPSQERVRIRYTTSELIPRNDLPDDFFDRTAVEAQVLTVAESLAKVRELGVTPYWLGENYESELGTLSLPPTDGAITDPTTVQAELHYALIVTSAEGGTEPILDTVIVRIGLDAAAFTPPLIPEVGGDLPESVDPVTVRGVTGTLYTSFLTPNELPCDTGDCPPTTAKLYRRLIFMIGTTAVQIETMARVGAEGQELDRYNTVAGIVALADTMFEATEEGQ